MNNRWLNMSPTVTAKKVATLKWPNSLRAGLVRIGTDNAVYYNYYNGSSWSGWGSLGFTASDIAAVALPNGQADIFIVGLDKSLKQYHSTNGQPGTWSFVTTHISCCIKEVATAVTPSGVLWLAAQATQNTFNNGVWVVSTSTSPTWTQPWTYLGQIPGGAGQVNDLTLLAYNGTVAAAGVSGDNCTLYQKHRQSSGVWDASWFAYSSSPCFKNVSSFNTSDGGAYLLYIGTNNNALHTHRFTSGAWAGIVQQGTRTWIAVAGANIDDEAGNAYEHTEYSDDCRVQSYTNGPICDIYDNCFWTQGVNLAEIIYNEARGETRGAQDTVGWTVRNRAFQGLSCDAYPGGNTVCATPCNDPNFCGSPYNTQRYCCAIHGGQTQWGTSGFQFNDEHVDINTLSSSGAIWEAFYVGNGWVGDVSTSWCPPGVAGCSFACSGPGSTSGSNYNSPSPSGPMGFRGSAYPPTASSCKRAPTVNTCSGAANNYVCCNASPNNYFWNRRP